MNSFEEKLKKTAQRLDLPPERIPSHIAIIMDGNGRWAQKKKQPRYKGHWQGSKTVEKISLYCVDLGIKCLTLYSFSSENWKRPKDEIDTLMYLYTRYLIEIRPILQKNNVKLIHLGRMSELPQEVKAELLKTMDMTSKNTGMVLALALNYSSRIELTDAVRKIAQKCKDGDLDVEDINEQCINQHLYTTGLIEPDLLIRTAGEMRVSNFLLWQISYCEFYVTQTLWPDFEKADLDESILAYSERNRRFGTVKSDSQ